MHWYVDALDRRAGVIFATQRKADLHLAACLSTADQGPTFFIAPPSFVPEPVARTVGFAMARAQGDSGLYLGGQELPFGSLAEISEFARRMYLGGASGDGPDENGVPPPPEGPEGGDPPPDFEGMDGAHEGVAPRSDPVLAWLALADSMRARSMELADALSALMRHIATGAEDPPSAVSSPVEPLPSLDTDADQSMHGRRLARGGLRVLRELYGRRPGNETDIAYRLHWLTALHRFAVLATRMGLWSPMRRELRRIGAFDGWETFLYEAHAGGEFAIVADMLLFGGPSNLARWGWPLPTISLPTDPFEDLALLPVSAQVHPHAPTDGQNLQSLLSAIIAMPNQLLENSPQGQARAELVLFAAACLNLREEHLPLWMEREDINDYFTEQLVDRAYAWIAQNSPKIVYAQQVEDLIKHAPHNPV